MYSTTKFADVIIEEFYKILNEKACAKGILTETEKAIIISFQDREEAIRSAIEIIGKRSDGLILLNEIMTDVIRSAYSLSNRVQSPVREDRVLLSSLILCVMKATSQITQLYKNHNPIEVNNQ